MICTGIVGKMIDVAILSMMIGTKDAIATATIAGKKTTTMMTAGKILISAETKTAPIPFIFVTKIVIIDTGKECECRNLKIILIAVLDFLRHLSFPKQIISLILQLGIFMKNGVTSFMIPRVNFIFTIGPSVTILSTLMTTDILMLRMSMEN